MKEYVILTTVDNYNSLGLVRTLGESGIKPIVISVIGKKNKVKMATVSKYCKKAYFVNSLEEALMVLVTIGEQSGEKGFLFTNSDDVSVFVDTHYHAIKPYFYFSTAGEQFGLTKLQDKEYQKELAKQAGFNVIPEWLVNVGTIPNDIEYPVITKATNSYGNEWKDIVYICNTEAELLDAFSKMKSDKVLLQKYIKKIDEWSYDGFSIDDGKQVFWEFQNREKYHHEGKYYPFWISKIIDDESFMKIANRFLELSKYSGIFEIETIIAEDGTQYFLEMNLRNTVIGWTSTIFEMPLATLWAKAIESGKIDPNWKHVPDHEIESVACCYDYDLRVKTKKISKLNWLKEYSKVESKLYRGRNDIVPFISFMWYKVTKMRKGR